MSTVRSRPAPDFYTSTDPRSVDELDAAIGRLVRQMNADSYRLLVLVREFDDRFGWNKAKSVFMRSRRADGDPSQALGAFAAAAASHNHKACKNAIRALGGR